jgi:hypothetical protein
VHREAVDLRSCSLAGDLHKSQRPDMLDLHDCVKDVGFQSGKSLGPNHYMQQSSVVVITTENPHEEGA